MTRKEACKALNKAATDLTKAEQKVAALEVERTKLVEAIDSKIKQAKYAILSKKTTVELATRAVLAPDKVTESVVPIPRFTDKVPASNGVAH